MCGIVQADQVTLTANDAIGQSSFNSALHWSNGLAPSSANTYVVPPGRELRTPPGGGSFTFAGSSLTISGASGLGGGVLQISGSNGDAITVNNLVLDYGYVVNSLGGTVTISGNEITLGNGGGFFTAGGVSDRSLVVSAPISGSGGAFIVNPGTVHFTAENSYSGNTLIQYSQNAATLQLDNANAIQNSTVILDANNELTFGSGIGSFNLGGLAGGYDIGLEDTTGSAVNVRVGKNGQSTTFGGVLRGGGSLTKTGAGALTLTGDNTFVGQTMVNEGILAINGSVDSTVTINNSGVLKGTGTIKRNVAVSIGGSVAPGSSVGNLHVSGDYTQVAGGQLHIEIGGELPGSYDQLLVDGSAALAGLLSVSLTNGFSPQLQDAFDILSWGSLLGTFDNIDLPPLAAGLTWNTSQLYSHGKLIVSLAGDFNFDQIVDNRDYLIWRHNLGYVVSPCGSGDANCNGFVEWSDYGSWRNNWGRTVESGSAVTAGIAVPEPAALVMLAMVVSLGLCRIKVRFQP